MSAIANIISKCVAASAALFAAVSAAWSAALSPALSLTALANPQRASVSVRRHAKGHQAATATAATAHKQRTKSIAAMLAGLVLVALFAPQIAFAEGFKLLSLSTLLGQIITFSILVWVVMKFVWPPLMNAIETRQQEIADGLAAAEQGRQSLADADSQRDALIADARKQAGQIVSEGEQRRNDMIAAARTDAEAEKARILEQGRRDLALERAAMARDMQQQVGMLAATAASQIVGREVDEAAHADILDSLKAKLQS